MKKIIEPISEFLEILTSLILWVILIVIVGYSLYYTEYVYPKEITKEALKEYQEESKHLK